MNALSPGMTILDDVIAVTSKAQIDKACEHAVASQAHHMLPLLHAARNGEIALVSLVDAQASFPVRQIERFTRPVVILVGDDPWPDGEALGPFGWDCARRLKYWAKAVVVNGAGAEVEHYRAGVEGALECRRMVFVETDSAHVAAWRDFLACPRTLQIVPRGGARHPQPPARGAMQ